MDKTKNVYYIKGNGRNYDFISKVCKKNFDAIVDFMNYDLEEFKKNYEILLNASKHYIFLSSARVYNNENILTENSKRLLDTITDIDFLSTQRYALRKAREEDILKASKYSNWTIIRPYITYSNMRLQLGIYEKEEWLYRILNGKKVVIRKEILDKYTTMTYGYDVAQAIYNILENEELFKDTLNIVTNESLKWKDILNIYLDVLNKYSIKTENMIIAGNQKELLGIEELFEGGFNTKYDRLWDRKFNNEKTNKFCGQINYKKIKEGLTMCLTDFINQWKLSGNNLFQNINEEYNNRMDYLCNNKIGDEYND